MGTMKRLTLKIFLTCILTLSLCTSVHAVVFTPNPVNIGDLDHNYYYAWKIQGWTIPQGQVIEEATLTITGINDWVNENNDHLYIHLMDSKRTGGTRVISGGNTFYWTDYQGGGDNWSTWGYLIANYQDTTNPWYQTETLTYHFSTLGLLDELTNYLTNDVDHTIFLGFDPDCHYFNDGVQFEIITRSESVPEPGMIILMSAGIAGFAFFRRYTK
jgi:hypothetical protein